MRVEISLGGGMLCDGRPRDLWTRMRKVEEIRGKLKLGKYWLGLAGQSDHRPVSLQLAYVTLKSVRFLVEKIEQVMTIEEDQSSSSQKIMTYWISIDKYNLFHNYSMT